jgi:hypothetical protein
MMMSATDTDHRREPNAPNTWVAALEAVKRTPIGQAGQYRQVVFFRDDRRHITTIREGQAQHWNNDHGAAELVRLNM